MRLCVAILLITGGVVVADEPKAGVKDKESLQGLWQAIELEGNGRKAPAEAVKRFRVLIKGDQLVFNPASGNRKHTFAIDPAAKPKALDLTPADGPAKGKKMHCAIYKLDGDKLTICLDMTRPTSKRPTEFKTTAGDRFVLIKLKRVKDKK